MPYITINGEKVTKHGKQTKWGEIADAINSLGFKNRTLTEVQAKWKNLVTEAKTKFHAHKNSANRTGGGPPPKPISAKTEQIIDLMKNDASFKGLPPYKRVVRRSRPLRNNINIEFIICISQGLHVD